MWAFLSVAAERDDDILQGYIFEKSDDEDENGASVDIVNDEILAKLFFAGEEAPRFILLFGINQIALIDRNKWNEKRYLQFMMDDIYTNYTELFIEVHNPVNVGVNENDLKYCLEKLFIRRDDYRDRMDEIKGWVNQYVVFDNTEKLSILFADSDIKKDNLFWLVDNKKKITDMTVEEIYTYIDSAKSFIEKRAEYH